MSVFSTIWRGRQRAKEHSQKQAEHRRKEGVQPTYRHVPAHAAASTPVAAPPTSRADDKPRIMEENRRTASIPNGAVTNTQGGMPRVSSGLSNVMYPAAHANPMVATQRSYGHHVPQQRQYHYRGVETDVVYSIPDPAYIPEMPRLPSLKEKQVDRGSTPGSSRAPSLLGDEGSDSAVILSHSISSCDALEMGRPERPAVVTGTTASPSITTIPTERISVPDSHYAQPSLAPKTHRLHPSRQRRLSDASIEKPHPPRPARELGPPPSTRGFSSIPPVPTIPPLPRPADSSMASSSSSLASIDSSVSSPMTASYHSRQTPNSSVSSTASSASYKAPQPTCVTPSAASEFVFPFSDGSASNLPTKPAAVGATPSEPDQTATPKARPTNTQPRARPYHTPNPQPPVSRTKPNGYYPPKAARVTENIAEVNPQPQHQPQPRPTRPTNWLTRRFSSSSRISVNEAPELEPPEPGSIAEAAERASGMRKAGKKTSAKLLKRNRWSSGSAAS